MLALTNVAYLVAAILFIVGMQMLSHPRSAVRGNLVGAVGMAIAIIVTLLQTQIVDYKVIFAGILVGSAIGAFLALKVQMTGMPQMVALLNGAGGGASTIVAGASLIEAAGLDALGEGAARIQFLLFTGATGIIGAITLWGSLVAWAKLEEKFVPSRSIVFSGQQAINLLLFIVCLGLCAWIFIDPANHVIYWALVGVASVLGVLVVLPIGGADMPVVISLLNSYSGIAGATTGFILNNYGLIITGSLVGASGIILSQIMCKAMNRSLTNVLFGVIDATSVAMKADDVYKGKVKGASAEELALLFDGARKVIIVPGYGLAVSQAQHAVRDFSDLLEERGIDVQFAIHPVAGRMPGHMNVLLAEAEISYEKLKEMDEINSDFQQTDVAIVIGANDVVNPMARTDPKSPIAGMPILDVDKARTVIVIKRSLSPGFAGIPNPLFAADNTMMYFADGKKAILDLAAAIKHG